MEDKIIKEQVFKQPIDQVWNAITKAEEISTWFIHADFKAEVGYAYTFTAPEEQNCPLIKGHVKEANPYTLVYTWVVENTDVETTVRWQLEQTADGTRLVLEHSGISKYTGDTAVAMFSSFESGWINCVKDLNAYLAKPVHVG